MRFATLRVDGREQGCIYQDGRWVPLDLLDEGLSGDLLVLVRREWPLDRLAELHGMASSQRKGVAVDAAAYCPLYRRPRKIWGIGLNYAAHAMDLGAAHPEQPASFLKGDHTIVGAGDDIVLPRIDGKITAEGELGFVVGRTFERVPEESVFDYVFGVCPILDQTAEGLLAKNPRYLTRSKNFVTFFSFGPELVTLDEFLADRAMESVIVQTWRSDGEVRTNDVGHMAHTPARLLSVHSSMMPWFAGDILSTGTPGAIPITGGDEIECRIDGLLPLHNAVVDSGA